MSTSVVKIDSRHRWVLKTIKPGWRKRWKLAKREARFLLKHGGRRFPRLLWSDVENHILKLSYCGKPLTKKTLPEDYVDQALEILLQLKEAKITHNDIKPSDILVLKGKLYLIDFGWCHPMGKGKHIPKSFPRKLGQWFRAPHKPDDRWSFAASIAYIKIHGEYTKTSPQLLSGKAVEKELAIF